MSAFAGRCRELSVWSMLALPALLFVGCATKPAGEPKKTPQPAVTEKTEVRRPAPGGAEEEPEVVPVEPVGPRSWPMFGGTLGRNLAAHAEKNIPSKWSIEKDK